MGWRELRAWLAVMNRQVEGDQPNPHAWTPQSRQNFDELDRKRRELRGRG